MRIVYYTSSINVIGRFVIGLSIGNALVRKGIDCHFTIVHSSPAGHLAGEFDHVRVPLETESELSKKNYHKSFLYKTLRGLKPDILLVNHQWFAIHNFTDEFRCKKIYLSDQAYDRHFSIPLPEGDMVFDPARYDRLIAIEPNRCAIPMETINPLVIRNRDEIYSRARALGLLDLDGNKKIALYSLTSSRVEHDQLRDKYAYLQSDYEIVTISPKKMIFPIVDYYNAFDLLVMGAGYNNVWSSIFFNKKALFEPEKKKFSDESLRVEFSRSFRFDVNGADQLVDVIMNL